MIQPPPPRIFFRESMRSLIDVGTFSTKVSNVFSFLNGKPFTPTPPLNGTDIKKRTLVMLLLSQYFIHSFGVDTRI